MSGFKIKRLIFKYLKYRDSLNPLRTHSEPHPVNLTIDQAIYYLNQLHNYKRPNKWCQPTTPTPTRKRETNHSRGHQPINRFCKLQLKNSSKIASKGYLGPRWLPQRRWIRSTTHKGTTSLPLKGSNWTTTSITQIQILISKRATETAPWGLLEWMQSRMVQTDSN